MSASYATEDLRKLLVAILRKEPRQAKIALMAVTLTGDTLTIKGQLEDWIHSSLQALSQKRAPRPPSTELKRIAKALLDHHFPG